MVDISLNKNLLSNDFLNDFTKTWSNDSPISLNSNQIQLFTHPFKICTVAEFLTNTSSVIDPLVREMTKLNWQHKQMDLYEFYQTTDLCNFTQPILKLFYRNLRDNVMPWMEKLTGIKLTHVSASCSMYNMGDHLLVHDDLLSDRQIAYVFYLSPWKNAYDWTSDMGGALELFGTDENGQPTYPIVKSIAPRNNQFVFFKVCSNSFHQVGEVTTMDFPRLTINGWFHGSSSVDCESKTMKLIDNESEQYNSANNETIDLSEWINEIYLQSETKSSVQKHIEDNSEASLEVFLIDDYFDLLASEIKSSENEFKWMKQGPANYRNYETLKLDSAVGPVKDLITVMTSKAMFQLLYEYTELDLYGDKANAPKCSITIYRLTNGSYSLLGNTESFADSSLDVVLYFNDTTNAGTITYVNPDDDLADNDNSDDDDNEDSMDDNRNGNKKDSVLLTLYPKNNALNLVYRSDGTAKFIKYVSKKCLAENEYVYVLFASYKE